MNILSTDGDALVDASRLIGAAVMPMLILFLSVIIGVITAGWPTLIGNLAVFLSGLGGFVRHVACAAFTKRKLSKRSCQKRSNLTLIFILDTQYHRHSSQHRVHTKDLDF